MSKQLTWTLPADRCGTCGNCAHLAATVQYFSGTPTDRKQWAQVVAAFPCEARS